MFHNIKASSNSGEQPNFEQMHSLPRICIPSGDASKTSGRQRKLGVKTAQGALNPSPLSLPKSVMCPPRCCAVALSSTHLEENEH